LVKNSLVKKEVLDGALSWRNSQFFYRQSSSRSLRKFHAVAVNRHSSMRNWLFGLPVRILCEQFPWCQWKWWACSWLSFSSVSSFSVTVSLDFPCMAHAFFPKCLSNHFQGLRSTSSEICTKFDAVPMSDPLRNRIRLDTEL
jgi:hypothetical protein